MIYMNRLRFLTIALKEQKFLCPYSPISHRRSRLHIRTRLITTMFTSSPRKMFTKWIQILNVIDGPQSNSSVQSKGSSMSVRLLDISENHRFSDLVAPFNLMPFQGTELLADGTVQPSGASAAHEGQDLPSAFTQLYDGYSSSTNKTQKCLQNLLSERCHLRFICRVCALVSEASFSENKPVYPWRRALPHRKARMSFWFQGSTEKCNTKDSSCHADIIKQRHSTKIVDNCANKKSVKC